MEEEKGGSNDFFSAGNIFFIFMILALFLPILLNITTAVITDAKTGTMNNTMDATLGFVIAQDYRIYELQSKINNNPVVENIPKYDSSDILLFKNQIVVSLIFFVGFTLLIFTGIRLLFSFISKEDNVGNIIWSVVITIAVIALMEFLYVLLTTGEMRWPFCGLFLILKTLVMGVP